MDDAGDPGEQHIDELAVHQDLDRAVEHFAENVLVEEVCAHSCLAHQSDESDEGAICFLILGTHLVILGKQKLV